ncbi:unnamed protein product [Prorocentrum cordatum]|uniref:Alpha-type protein kinase domain-containing protein n=1 Tax=Prorocentrum cordatum TaxID=2364126 RepID=A0ABN9T695_9DINO|nr:unnamed protein product [Polarella glacialis]
MADFPEFRPAIKTRVTFAPSPFAEGSMRLAHYAFFHDRYYVIKCFNDDTQDFIQNALQTTYAQAVLKDIRCQMFAITLANIFNGRLSQVDKQEWQIKYAVPSLVAFGREMEYAEPYMAGDYVRYNDNNGNVQNGDTTEGKIAASFCHFTYEETNGRAMVVDIQGVGLHFTDAQVHTRCIARTDELFKRFGMGNMGKYGMTKFFRTHKCNSLCQVLGLTPRDVAGL